MELTPIGTVRSTRSEPVDDGWDAERSEIVLDPAVLDPDAVTGLGEFSHVEVVYLLDRVDPSEVVTGARRPRGNPAWPEVGILAQRARSRPNRIGTAVCRLLGLDGLTLSVAELDAVDGTPVLDVKPWMDEFGPRGDRRQPEWSRALMEGYWSGSSAAGPGPTGASYDAVATSYTDALAGELATKPLDRALIAALVETATAGPHVDVGCGPGQVAAEAATHGIHAVGVDLSPAMCTAALGAGLPAAAGDMTALPLRDGAAGALTCFYAVIHLDRAARLAAYREFARVLAPGAPALVAFHVSDEATAPGGARRMDTWWDRPVDLTFRFLDPDGEEQLLHAAGLEPVAKLERAPGPEEHQSRRAYLLARRGGPSR